VLEAMLATPPSEGRAMFVDMNSFFATVEQQAQPQLRGRPIGVCPYLHNSTCVIAASIEAKRYGVKTGTPIPEARRLCPEIILIQDNPRLYREYHREIMDMLDDTRCQVTIKSIDEAYLEVPRDLRANTTAIAGEIKTHLTTIGSQLQCSIGVASNLFLAKMGSNFKKPNGLTTIRSQDLEDFYAEFQLTDLYGIARRLAQRFRDLGIYTPLDLYHAPYPLLRQAFGANGQAWYLRLRGYEVDLRPTKRRIIGHQTTIVPEPAHTRDEVLAIASQLTYKAASRLRQAGFAARSLVIDVRYVDRSHWTRLYRGKTPIQDSTVAFDEVTRLLQRAPLRLPVRRLSISFTDLIPHTALPQSLFTAPAHPAALSRAIDEIEERWGRLAIAPARQLLREQISDRIGFGNAPHSAEELPD
jgi:DNA polymerase-4